MRIAYGFTLLIVIVVGCFGYEVYLISQLQSQVKTLQNQNDQNMRPKLIVLTYSWADEPWRGSYYLIVVNCTLLNASPENATNVFITIMAQFGTRIEEYSWEVDSVLTPWQTKTYNKPLDKNYDLELLYNKTYDGNPDAVWLEPGWYG
jgi:hypothetical protein